MSDPDPNYRPLTMVDPEFAVTLDEMAARVEETRVQHGDILQRYHDVWYNSKHTWHYTHFLGVGLMKSPNDLWAYQELMAEHRFKTVIETGTYTGGSALWFAYLMDMLGIEGGHVYTIDREDFRRCAHPRITFLAGDSRDADIRDAIGEATLYNLATAPTLVVLDADHSADHVRQELELYAPLCKVGDWLVVEDTNISWLGERGDRGARGGLEDYLAVHEGEFRQDILCERWLLTMHPGGWLQRVGECHHGEA